MNSCPLESSKEWKTLLSQTGEKLAWATWAHYNGYPPTLMSKSDLMKALKLPYRVGHEAVPRHLARLREYNAKNGTSHSVKQVRIGRGEVIEFVLHPNYLPVSMRNKGVDKFQLDLFEENSKAAFNSTYPAELEAAPQLDIDDAGTHIIDELSIGQVIHGKTIVNSTNINVRAFLKSLLTNPELSNTTQSLLKALLSNPNTSMLDDVKVYEFEGEGEAFYVSQYDAILVKNGNVNNELVATLLATQIIHELGHRATIHVFSKSEEELTTPEKNFKKRTETLYNIAKSKMDLGYAGASVEEFISEFLANPELQDKLKRIPFNWLEAFWFEILKMLGLSEYKNVFNAMEGTLYMHLLYVKPEKVDNEIRALDRKSFLAKLDATQTQILEPTYTTEADNRYRKADMTEVENRVTDAQQKLFESIYGKDRAEEINNNERNIAMRSWGIAFHETARRILKGQDTKAPVEIKGTGMKITVPPQAVAQIALTIKGIIAEAQEKQKKIDPNKVIEIRTENRVYSEKEDLAGSIDLIITYSNGVVDIYDYKFINFKDDKNRISFHKEQSFNMQLGKYKEILRDQYGVEEFGKTRIIPFAVEYETKKGKIVGLKKIMGMLDPLPVANELTGDKALDKLITTLRGTKTTLLNQIKGSTNREAIEARIFRIDENIKGLILRRDTSGLVKEIDTYVRDTNKLMDSMTIGELVVALNTLGTYKEIVTNLAQELQNKETPKEDRSAMFDEAAHAAGKATLAYTTVLEKIKEKLIEQADAFNIPNLLEPQQERGVIASQLTYLSEWQHPMFKLFYKYVRQFQDGAHQEYKLIEAEAEKQYKSLSDWASSQGMSVQDAYNRIYNARTGNIIGKFTPELYEEIEKRRKDKDIKWFQANFTQSDAQRKAFEEFRDKVFKRYEKDYAWKGEEYVEWLKEQWNRNNDVQHESGIAWLNSKVSKVLNEEEKYYSAEYKYIYQQGNEALKDYYEWYKNTMGEVTNALPPNLHLHENYVPWVAKAVGEIGSNPFVGLKKTFESLQVQESDSSFGMINPNTGELEQAPPLYYVSPLRDVTGSVDLSLKSTDLTRSLLLFSRMALNYKHIDAVRESAYALKEIIAQQPQILTDNFGKPIKKDGEYQVGSGSKVTEAALRGYIDYYIHGRKIQTKDKVFKWGDANYSMSKTLQKGMQFFSLKALAFNPVSIGANYVGGRMNIFYEAYKGQYFTKEQNRAATALFAKQDKKYLAAFRFFEVSQENLDYRKANELSSSQLTRVLTSDNLMAGQRMGDNMVDRQVTVSMMMNYGINPADKTVRKLSTLPAGTKSLWDLMELTDTGVSFGMSKEEFEPYYYDFRRQVKYVASKQKGNNSTEDLALYKTNMVGLMLGQFRGWMPRMASERFGAPKYIDDVREWEIGRYRVLWGEFTIAGFGALKFLLNNLGYHYKSSDSTINRLHSKFEAETGRKISREEFIELRNGQLRAAAHELRIFLALSAIIVAAAGDWDDDGQADYKKYLVTRQAVRLLDRAQTELGFFFLPTEFNKLLRAPVPMMGLLLDVQRLVGNTYDEFTDSLIGEDDKNDQSPLFHRTLKLVPIVNPVLDWFEVFEGTGREWKPRKGETGLQLQR